MIKRDEFTTKRGEFTVYLDILLNLEEKVATLSMAKTVLEGVPVLNNDLASNRLAAS